MTRSSIDDCEIRRALADLLDLAPPADATPVPRPAASATRRRMLVPAAAAVIAVAGAAAIAAIAPGQRGSAPATGVVSSPAGEQTSASILGGGSLPPAAPSPSTPAELGWPPLFTLGPEWQLTSFSETSPENGDFEFHAASGGADTSWHLVESTNAAGEETASEVVPGRGVIIGQWLPGDRVGALGLDTGNFDAVEGPPTRFAGAPARVFHVPDEQRFFVIVDLLPQGSLEIVIQGNQRSVVQAILNEAEALDPQAFAATLPGSVTTPEAHGDLITELLGDTPRPDAFRLSDAVTRPAYIEPAVLATQLNVEVACAWMAELYAAQGDDPARFAAAAAALEAHATWAVATNSSAGYVDSIGLVIGELDPDHEGLAASFGYTPALGWESLSAALGCADPNREPLSPVEPN